MPLPDDGLLLALQQTFKAEAVEYLQTLNSALLRLERTSEQEKYQALLHEAFRAAHNMKGAARTVEFKNIQNLAHAIETVLQRAREENVLLTPDRCDVVYLTLDDIKGLLDDGPVKLDKIAAELAGIGVELEIADVSGEPERPNGASHLEESKAAEVQPDHAS